MAIKTRFSSQYITLVPENYPQPFIMLGNDGKILYVNSLFEKLTGFSSTKLIGKKHYPWIPGRSKSSWFRDVVMHLSQNETKWEEAFVTATSDRKYAEITATSAQFKEERQCYLLTWQDITERVSNQRILQEIQEYNSNLLENSPYPIIVLNSDTSIKYVNETFESLTGFSCKELAGSKAPYPWWAEKSTPARIKRLKNSMEKGEHKFERMFRKKNGELFWAEITSRAIRENGKLKYYLSNWVNTCIA